MVPVILDIDGTLVDTNYHHALAWQRALREHGETVPAWQIHRHIGMGGDQIVTALAGEEFEQGHGDAVRETEGERYQELIDEVGLLPGARGLLVELRARGITTVLASSAKADEVDVYLDMLDARELVDDWTTSADVEATKPEPDLVRAALDKAGSDEAVLVGDSVWDCKAAARAGIPTVGVLTGGFSRAELLEAGATVVYESAAEVCAHLDEPPFGSAVEAARMSVAPPSG
ncbi:MAG TPA: HAD family hydrolase [Thermoleophilaceae bacterium]|nr:HAD family hydrolase [Thermoleophilaceae bacterium]